MGPHVAPIQTIADEAVAHIEGMVAKNRRSYRWICVVALIAVCSSAWACVLAFEPPRDVPVPPMPKGVWSAGVVPAPTGPQPYERVGRPMGTGTGEVKVYTADGIETQLSRLTTPNVFDVGDRFKLRDDCVMEVAKWENNHRFNRRDYDLVRVGDVSMTFQLSEEQVIALARTSIGAMVYKTHPNMSREINDAEVARFQNEGGPPPTWQPNGNGWEYTGRRFIAGAYWEKLTSEGWRLRGPATPR